MSGFNLVNQFGGFAYGGKQVVPPARHEQRIGKAKHSIRDGVASVMVVEQPRVNILFAKSSLDCLKIHSCRKDNEPF